MLVSALHLHEGALRASLQTEYGLRLLSGDGELTDPPRNTLELADLVEWLPSGCALGRSVGGEVALSLEAMLIRQTEFTLRANLYREHGAKGSPPEPLPLPRAPGDAKAEQAEQSAKARAYAARMERLANGR